MEQKFRNKFQQRHVVKQENVSKTRKDNRKYSLVKVIVLWLHILNCKKDIKIFKTYEVIHEQVQCIISIFIFVHELI